MAKTNDELQAMTKAELEDYADTLKLDLKPHQTKDEMISAILAAQRAPAAAPTSTADTPAKRYAQARVVQICGQCKYYFEGIPDPKDPTRGLCKRYPPQIVTTHTPITAHFPPMSSLDTCGEFAH